ADDLHIDVTVRTRSLDLVEAGKEAEGRRSREAGGGAVVGRSQGLVGGHDPPRGGRCGWGAVGGSLRGGPFAALRSVRAEGRGAPRGRRTSRRARGRGPPGDRR